MIQITVLTRSPDGRCDTSSIVSNILFWACASSADVYMGYTRSGTKFSKIGVGSGYKKRKKRDEMMLWSDGGGPSQGW